MIKLIRLPYLHTVRFETPLSKERIYEKLNQLNFYNENDIPFSFLFSNDDFISFIRTEDGFIIEHSFSKKAIVTNINANAQINELADKTLIEIEYKADTSRLRFLFYFVYIFVGLCTVFILPDLYTVLVTNNDFTILIPLITMVILATTPQWLPAIFLSGPTFDLNSKIYSKIAH